MTLQASVTEFCRQYGKAHVWIAYSGGLDSTVLLDICHGVAQQEKSLQFHVLHAHHGLSSNADAWAERCADTCRQYGMDFHLIHLQLANKLKVSLEDAARTARYQAFAERIKTGDLLLTAHHQHDQAETVLLQLLRGAGPKGLAAMPALKLFHAGLLGRPLLNVSRDTLLHYAREKNLSWIEDESNQNTSLTRNFLRHDILPVLTSRWPSVEATLARTAQHCAEAQTLLDEVAAEKLGQVRGSVENTLSVTKLLSFSPEWQRLLLRGWIEEQGFALPDTDKMNSIQDSVLGARQDRQPCVKWQDVTLRRHQGNLHLTIDGVAQPEIGAGLKLDRSAVIVRQRIPGETVEILNRGRIALKNLFQEWQVPAWERGTLPLMFYGNKLIQAAGYFKDPAYFL